MTPLSTFRDGRPARFKQRNSARFVVELPRDATRKLLKYNRGPER